MNQQVLISFDVEEFDMPLEYQYQLSLEQQMKYGKDGLDILMPLIDSHKIPTTLFTTANFANSFPDSIRALASNHEIASHTFYHSHFKNDDLLDSKLLLEKISGQKITGLRMPRMRQVDINEVAKAGYHYDSSINPTWIPGKYNNLSISRTAYKENKISRIPASVSPGLRIPLFWLSFKNFPYPYFKQLLFQTLKKDGYVCLYFHPWEFIDINHLDLPAFTRKHCGEPLLNRISQLITDLKKWNCTFSTMHNFNQQYQYEK